MKHHNCNCDILDKPSYHASDDPHSVGKKWVCPVHGKQEKTWLIHTEKQEYCKPCQEAPEKQTCKFHPNGCINDGIHAEVPKQNIAATQQGDESVKVFTYEGSAFAALTDEGWTTEFYDKFGLSSSWWNSKYKSQTAKAVEEFIRELLQKERERGIAEGRADEAIFCHEHKGGGYEAGKSEAFSLMRKIAEEMFVKDTTHSMPLKAINRQTNRTLNEILTRLSTLEGK